ncbi:hypothetical protein K443DRAFT_13695 [Laccaria amethystina LaAM-08-1]|uniref:Uncharacterized protein n=1 Tax=Laccaria amethystina LaAM-08-1 TaxID=1095629 RepID=A0A0C9WI49_9AGAR|nr:hypothetical protein K443DRAFT_13695 [Laccaria amethystina LaAM-08-1]
MSEVPKAPNVTLISGPMLIGVFFNMILYGVRWSTPHLFNLVSEIGVRPIIII